VAPQPAHTAASADLGSSVVLGSILVNLLGLALPVVLLQVYDRIIPREAVESLAMLVLGLLIAVSLEIALRASRVSILHWAGARFEHALRMKALDHAMRCDLAALEQESSGAHLERMAGIEAIREHRAGEAALTRYDLLFVILFLGVIGWISPLVAAVIVGMMLASLALGEVFGRRIRDRIAERQTQDGERWSFMIETLGAMEAVKSMAIEGAMERRYDRLSRASATLGRDVADMSAFATGLNAPIMQITVLLVASVGATQVMADSVTVGGLAACVLLSNRAMQPILGLQAARNRRRLAAASAERLDRLFAAPIPEARNETPGLIETLELEGAGFDRPDGWPILHDVRLSVSVGETVAIDGANGSGKSTLLWMLSGDLEPHHGRLLVNDRDARLMSPERLQEQIGFLTQRCAMLDGTVLDNLTRFDPERNMDAAMRLCRMLGLDRWFAERPEGLYAEVGGGVNALPPAIEQQVAIVRALVLRPRVILYDEAGSGLDPAVEARLVAYLLERRRDAAIVMATRRTSFAALAHRRYRIARYGLVDEPRVDLSEPSVEPIAAGAA
jgi:ATP-binding cassette subfamily C protein LapB